MTSSDPSKDLPREPAPANAGDPSMEDILASIRRILSEDEPAANAPAPEHGNAADDVLTLDASMMLPDPEPHAGNAPSAYAPMQPPHAKPEPAPYAQVPVSPPVHTETYQPAAPPQAAPSLDASLVAPAAAAAAASSVGTLVRSIAAERSMQVYSGGPTIEDIVRAEIRPLLKQWLDENLPPMVERLVRAELERVVGRAIT